MKKSNASITDKNISNLNMKQCSEISFRKQQNKHTEVHWECSWEKWRHHVCHANKGNGQAAHAAGLLEQHPPGAHREEQEGSTERSSTARHQRDHDSQTEGPWHRWLGVYCFPPQTTRGWDVTTVWCGRNRDHCSWWEVAPVFPDGIKAEVQAWGLEA